MNVLLPAFFLFALPAAFFFFVALRVARKKERRSTFLERMNGLFSELGAEQIQPQTWKWKGRVYHLDAMISPLFSRQLSPRLSAFCDSVYEFELKDVRNSPLPLPEPLAQDDYFGRFSLSGVLEPELTEYLLQTKKTLPALVPSRWGAFSKQHIEVVLSGGRFDEALWSAEDLRADLQALGSLASIPLRRRPRGGVVTWREGFEKQVPEWHWKAGQREGLPIDLRRFVFSFYHDNTALNLPIVELLYRLAASRRKLFLTHCTDLDFLRYGFGDAFSLSEQLLEAANPEIPVAADQYLDGDFFQGLFAADDDTLLRDSYRNEIRFRFHERAAQLLDGVYFYARRLFDDEHSWFSGEYEIVSRFLDPAEVRTAVQEMAERHEARFLEMDRRFSFKLLKNDRLEMTT